MTESIKQSVANQNPQSIELLTIVPLPANRVLSSFHKRMMQYFPILLISMCVAGVSILMYLFALKKAGVVWGWTFYTPLVFDLFIGSILMSSFITYITLGRGLFNYMGIDLSRQFGEIWLLSDVINSDSSVVVEKCKANLRFLKTTYINLGKALVYINIALIMSLIVGITIKGTYILIGYNYHLIYAIAYLSSMFFVTSFFFLETKNIEREYQKL